MNPAHDEHQYRFSRSHATRQLLHALRGWPPEAPASIDQRPTDGDSEVGCGEAFPHVLRVYALDPGGDVTCPKCRELMRLIRPRSVPRFEVREDLDGRAVYYVAGEPVGAAAFAERTR